MVIVARLELLETRPSGFSPRVKADDQTTFHDRFPLTFPPTTRSFEWVACSIRFH